jgi:phosphate butyryltransferase
MLALPLLGPPSAKTDRLSAPARLDDVIAVASAEGERCTVAVVGADNEEALLAAKQANEAGPRPLARFLLVGPYSRISQLSWELDVAIDQDNLVIVDAGDPVETAVELMRAGLADTLMKGSVTTAALLKGYLGYLKGKGLTGRGLRLSHLGMFEIPGRSKLVGITDAAINTYPDVEARIEILENALDALHLLGYQRPKVAVVSAVEKPSKAVTSSVEGEVIATRFQGRQDLIIEGPLSVDLALSPQSAREKGYRGRIQGDADLLLVPDIDAGNAIYKAFTVTSGAALAGAVIGGEVPFILTSRGDSSRSKFASVALVLALTRRRKARGNSDRQVGRPK